MGLIALLCLLLPISWPLLASTTAPALDSPLPYFMGVIGLLLFFAYWSQRHGRAVGAQVPWIAYLLAISILEEIAFRLAG